MEEKYKNAIEEFNKYTKQYNMNNEMISRKYYHTFRVANYAKEIAKSENLNEQDTYIAFLCGLLHDIARFKQATEFNTFNDFLSFDHGDDGYNILLENNYIDNFVDNDIDKNIVLKAVKNHNKFSIDETLNEREMYFSKLTRDADKLDILDKQKNEINDGSTTIDKDVMDAFVNHRLYKRDGTILNDASEIVKTLCLVFDFNFERSMEIVKEKELVDRKLEVLEENVDEDTMKEIRAMFP